MRVVFIILFAVIYRIEGHNERGHAGTPPTPPGHVTRKMEEYVHDMEYEAFILIRFYLLNMF
jgi:hypothetical protein